MIGATIILTAVYWLSDLAAAMWMGGLLMVSLMFALPLDILPQGASPAAVIMGATTAVAMIDRLRPFVSGAAVILLVSVVLGVLLERRARRSIAWWVIWLLRSISGVAMVGVALYSFGNLDSHIARLEYNMSTLQNSLAIKAATDTTVAGATLLSPAIMQNPYESATTATVRANFAQVQARYRYWMWIQLVLGSAVLFAGALKQAAWRRSWGVGKEAEPESPPEPPQNA
jgi:hypothetical protein